MNESISNFRSELRISLGPVFVVLMAWGLAFVLVGDSQPYVSERAPVFLLALSFFAVSAAAWVLDNWRPLVGRWFTVVASVAIVHLGYSWLGMPGFLSLMVIPTALAVVLVGMPFAVATALGESVLLLLPLKYATADVVTAGVALAAIWSALGIMYAAYRRMYQQSKWLAEYMDRAQRSLEETRDRKAERHQALESLRHANRQLALTNERIAALRRIAEEAQRAKTAFVANVSHEFRTPLNMIIGLVELMVDTPELYAVALSPRMREDLEVVHRNCMHLSNMISDVLDLTQVEAGCLVLNRERVNLQELIDRAAAVVRPLMEKKQLPLRIATPNDLPEVYCDRTRIRQVILNLVSNAARFTEEGEIKIQVVRQDNNVLVSVVDTGSGISQDDAERIFEPFCQGTSGLWRDKGGSGLGLSISRQFVKLHGGRIWLESQLGVGTTFFFTLPISPPLEHVARSGHQIREEWVWRERASRTEPAVSAEQLVRPRVIVCDETGALYPVFVRHAGEVEFVDTRELMQAAQELQQCPAHAVILNAATLDDLLASVETVRQEVPGTPIIGCSVPRPVERAVDAGALGHLIKPVTRADLEKAIQAVGKPVRRVLVVDDDPDVLRLFSRTLQVCDNTLEVATACNGAQAMSELRRAVPDLVLLDIVMPDMDGWQVLESMSRDERIGAVPTFLVSAQDPTDQMPASRFLLATMDRGLPLSKLIVCALETSARLLKPEEGFDLVPL